MKSMFGPVKEKPAMQRLEPTSDVSPELLLHPGMFEDRSLFVRVFISALSCY